jgi:hypothetical protein
MSDLDLVRHPVSSLAIVAKMDIPGFPDWVGTDEVHSAVWISNRNRSNIARLNTTTDQLANEVAVSVSSSSRMPGKARSITTEKSSDSGPRDCRSLLDR